VGKDCTGFQGVLRSDIGTVLEGRNDFAVDAEVIDIELATFETTLVFCEKCTMVRS
jgi:hypothetical protein